MENMDIGRSFTFVFEDQNWVVKILIGGLVVLFSFLLIPIPIILGYQVTVIRNTARGADLPLPEWDNFGRYFSEGIQLIIGGIVYYLPVILLVCVGAGIGALTSNSNGNGSGAAGVLVACLNCIIGLLSLALGLIFPAAVIRYAATGRLAAMFEFGKVWDFIRNNPGNYIVAVLLGWVASLVAGVVAVFTCFLGTPWTSWWSTLVQGHLLGQVWRAAQGSVTGAVAGPELGGSELPA
ncbi:MAG: DUF4013 domain-containing protein [Ardenticatenaceae bacterium]|nr:DUF4013 domain-containing protein [Ardenticatenaceae bacterium]